MSKDKCSNCGNVESDTFWTFEDNTMLCKDCHKKYGKKWQKEIEGKKKYTQEGPKVKRKWSIWAIVIIVVLIFIVFDNEETKTEREDAIKDAIDCLNNCESQEVRCSITTSAGESYSDLLEDNEQLKHCLDKFSYCVDDCKTTLELY